MYYYHVVFNRPVLDTLIYSSIQPLPVGIRVFALLESVKLTAVIIRRANQHEIHALLSKKIIIKAISKVMDGTPLLHDDQIALAQWMSGYYLASLGECVFAMIPSAKQQRDVSLQEEMISYFPVEAPALNNEQRACVSYISRAFSEGIHNTYYVHGVTGSGKTEVFIQLSHTVIQQGKQVIYLVPEIALVLQCIPLFLARFGRERVAILHSKLTASQRLREWVRIKNGDASIILGVRSAVFAPVHNLGLIVLDEEHDTSYKSERTPRYHARQVAMRRCNQWNAVLVMGSATPSVESWYHKQKQTINFCYLRDRVAGGALPEINIIPLGHTKRCITIPLKQEIEHTIKKNGQVLLMVNRRGFARAFLCSECGESIQCSQCSVSMTFHKTKNILLCHYCGFHTTLPEACPSCGCITLGIKGWGTQRVEEEVKYLFPSVSVARFDSDIQENQKESHAIFQRFYKREISILIGTQMIAKGVNFPHLHLVGILFADTLFSLPDFRATERAFSLLVQVAGRSGRFSHHGKVLVQGYATENPVLQYLKNRQQEKFYENELSQRKIYGLAPYVRMLRIIFRGMTEEALIDTTRHFAENIKTVHPQCDFLGPAPCAIPKIADKFRYHILLKSPSQKMLLHVCRTVLADVHVKKYICKKKVHIDIDTDPQSFM